MHQSNRNILYRFNRYYFLWYHLPHKKENKYLQCYHHKEINFNIALILTIETDSISLSNSSRLPPLENVLWLGVLLKTQSLLKFWLSIFTMISVRDFCIVLTCVGISGIDGARRFCWKLLLVVWISGWLGNSSFKFFWNVSLYISSEWSVFATRKVRIYLNICCRVTLQLNYVK